MSDKAITILVADDSKVARMHICSILSSHGYDTIQAENGLEAFKLIMSKKPDAVILDILMPEMDGIMLLKKLNALHIKIPSIVISADIQDDVQKECFELGIAAFLHKPFQEQELIKVISNNT
jgi:CheY-like chemotaxis protein